MVSIAGMIIWSIVSFSIHESEAASADIRLRTQALFTVLFESPEPFGDKEGVIDNILPNIPDSKLYYGFSIRRSRFDLRGHTITKSLRYRLQAEFAGASVSLLDFIIDYKFSDIFSIRAGQYKIPYNREELTSAGELEFVDRSVINSYFSPARDIGMNVTLGPEMVKVNLGAFTGWGRGYVRVDKTNLNVNLLYVARVEISPVGKMVYPQPNLKGEEAINIGLSAMLFPVSQVEIDSKKISGRRDKSDVFRIIENKAQKTNLLSFSGDAKVWSGPLSFELEAHLANLYDSNILGIRIQPSYMFTQNIGLAFRFSSVLNEKDKPIFEPGIAFSYYFKDHTKLQVDYINQRGPINKFASIRTQFQIEVK